MGAFAAVVVPLLHPLLNMVHPPARAGAFAASSSCCCRACLVTLAMHVTHMSH